MKVPEGDFLASRRRALEDSFFHERDRKLLESLRGELQNMEDRRRLAHVSSILDDHILKDLVACGINAETLAAISMIPLVEVAWCDGHVSPREREAILKSAAANGVEDGSACHQLLNQWLEHRPDARVITSWKEYIASLDKMMPADSMQKLRRDLFDRLRTIAKAAGGLLGVHKISKVEQDKIDELSGTGLSAGS